MSEIHYTVDARDTRENILSVTLEFQAHSKDVELCMPVWTPGSYFIADFPGRVISLSAFSGRRELATRKKDKSTWLVSGCTGTVRVHYRVHAHRATVHDTFFDDTHLTVNGASLFLFVRGLEHLPALVEILPHAGWEHVSTGLPALDRWKFSAPDYDTLVDSPIEAGNHARYTFTHAGREHELAIYGKGYLDAERLLSDLRKIVAAEIAIMKEVPYDRYVFIYHLLPNGGGGLEHLNSTHCIADPFGFTEREEYISHLTTFSHEFFHLWNVKRLRPSELMTFDYARENYTSLLWFSEGFTSYYASMAMRRAGIFTPAEFLRSIARLFETYRRTPGRFHQSAAESSFDTWIKFYRQDENSVNSTISYYNKGAIIATLLDILIISETENRRLDDVMRSLYRGTYMKGRGLTENEFTDAVSEHLGRNAGGLCRTLIHGRGELPFSSTLRLAGLVLWARKDRKHAFLGIVPSKEKSVIASVIEGSPAAEAPLFPGDEIIAVDGMRVRPDEIKGRIAQIKPGSTVQLLISRKGRIREMTCGTSTAFPSLQIVQSEGASERQKAVYGRWIYAPWRRGIDYSSVKDHHSYVEKSEMY